MKRLFSAIAVLAIVSGAVAFKTSNKFASGSVFCSTTCAALQQVAYRIDPVNGSTTPNPCSAHSVTTPYYFDATNTCVITTLGTTKFKATTDQGN